MIVVVPSPTIAPNPTIDRWFDFSERGRVALFTGKVEIGQGIETALMQIAADRLGVSIGRIRLRSGETEGGPNEGYTAGSTSIEMGGSAIMLAATSARAALLEEAGRRLSAAPEALSVNDGRIVLDAKATHLSYWDLFPGADFKRPVKLEAVWDVPTSGGLIGRNIPRVDLLDKITGAAFVHDIALPDMLHARVLRPPSFTAQVGAVDLAGFKRRAGGAKAWRSGRFIAVAAEKEYDAVKALEILRQCVTWTETEDLPAIATWPDYLTNEPCIEDVTEAGQRPPEPRDLTTVTATYSRPPIAHASIAPSCAVAHWSEGVLQIHTASQNVFNLRAGVALGLGLATEQVQVTHTHSAGCYGHNGSDDSAMDAAILAMAFAPHPVRLQWTRQDEQRWAPFGSAMAVRIEGSVDKSGAIVEWSTDIWSGTHCKRPAFLPGLVDLLGAAHCEPPKPISSNRDVPLSFIGCDRNSEPPYGSPRLQIVRHKLPDLPFRFSSLRTLGGFANVFAIECFMDELAERAGLDPVEFRLRNLNDPRGKGVVEAVVNMVGRERLAAPGPDKAFGLAYSRYKNDAAFLAAIAEVNVSAGEIVVEHVYAAVDAGLPINPDGLKNQIEGGVIQAVSWALMEEVKFDRRAITSVTWEDYPIYRFDAVPEVSVEIVDPGGNPPLGVGEAAQGPAAAAVANAAARALGVRVRDLPLSRANIIRALDQ